MICVRKAICGTLVCVGLLLAVGGVGTVEMSNDLSGFVIGAVGVGMIGLALLVQGY